MQALMRGSDGSNIRSQYHYQTDKETAGCQPAYGSGRAVPQSKGSGQGHQAAAIPGSDEEEKDQEASSPCSWPS